MLVLDTVNKSITVAMSGAAATTNPDFVTAYSDDNGTTFVEGSSDGALNGTSQVTLVLAPAASTRRLIKSIYIENKDTAAVTITVTLNSSSTLRTIAKVTLQVGDTWSTDGTTDTNGNIKTVQGAVSLTTGVTGILPIANGGTNASTASITSFNNITGYTASGATGTTSTNLVFSTSPTLVTPFLGTPQSGVLTTCTGYTTVNLVGTITNAQLANSTISGISLGSSLANLTAGSGITFSSGTTYNGSTAITMTASGGVSTGKAIAMALIFGF